MDKKTIEIPFGAFDSELHKWEYTIPEGYEAEIKDGKVIIKKKDSEDEKIMKSLVEYFRKFNPKNMWDEAFSFGDVLSYLEKQKEQKPAEWSEKDKECRDELIQYIEQRIGDDTTGQSLWGKWHSWIKSLPERFNLQSKQEWSDKDEDMLKSIIATCQLAAQDRDSGPAWKLCEMQEKFLKSLRPRPKQEWSEDSVKFEEGFKAGRESGLRDGQKYVLNNLDSYGLCEVTEWSEEDEADANLILKELEEDKKDSPDYSKHFARLIDWFTLRFKSLRPQPKQEWSEKYIADVFEKVGLSKIVREQGNDALTNAVQSAMIELSKVGNAEWSESVAKDMFIKALERAVEQTKKGYELTDCDKHSWWEDFKAYSGIKPAEWSEEDEHYFQNLIMAVDSTFSDGNTKNWLQNRLKSLRPQPEQKRHLDMKNQ